MQLRGYFNMKRIQLILEPRLIPRFFLFLRQGVELRTRVGCSVKALLCDELGIRTEYLDERVQTLFLDGKPVDDVTSARVPDGSTLALSAAMPGLAGATLRKGGFYARMRGHISHKEETAPLRSRQGTVILKLFNFVGKELGPGFLKQGVWIKGKALEDFFQTQGDDFWGGCEEVHVDGKAIAPDQLPNVRWGEKKVFLQLHPSG
jgi:hypothetical protein